MSRYDALTSSNVARDRAGRMTAGGREYSLWVASDIKPRECLDLEIEVLGQGFKNEFCGSSAFKFRR